MRAVQPSSPLALQPLQVPAGLLLHLVRGEGPAWDVGMTAAAIGALAGGSTTLYKIISTFAGGRGV